MQDGIRLCPADFLPFLCSFPFLPQPIPKPFAFLQLPLFHALFPHSEAPFSPVPAQAVSFVSSFVTLTTMLIGDLEMECSILDLHLYVCEKRLLTVSFQALHSLNIVHITCTRITCRSFMLHAPELWYAMQPKLTKFICCLFSGVRNLRFEKLISWRQ